MVPLLSARSILALGCATALSLSSTAYAQQAASAGPAATPTPAPTVAGTADVVRLRDGTLFRGTIVEQVPNDHVVIQTATGEQRRFAMTDVLYAGPAARDPAYVEIDYRAPTPSPTPAPTAPPAPPPTVPGAIAPPPPSSAAPPTVPMPGASGERTVTVRIQSSEPNTTLFLRQSTGYGVIGGAGVTFMSFQRVCTAPCEATLPVGHHYATVSVGGGRERGVPGGFDLQTDAVLDVGLRSRRGLRVASALMMVAGFVGGSLVMAFGPRETAWYSDRSSITTGTMVGGGMLYGVGLTGGILLLTSGRDVGRVDVRPGA